MQSCFSRKLITKLGRVLLPCIVFCVVFSVSSLFADSAALMEAVRTGQLEKVRHLLNQNERVDLKDRYGYTLLHYAASLGHPEIGVLLIAHGAEVDAKADQDLTPLMIAAMEGHVDVIRILVEKGAKVDSLNFKEQVTPLWAAAKLGRIDVVKALLALGANAGFVDSQGKTPLQSAHSAGHQDIVKIIRSHKLSH